MLKHISKYIADFTCLLLTISFVIIKLSHIYVFSPPLLTFHSIGGLKDRFRVKSDDAFFVYVGDRKDHLFVR